MSPLRRCRCSWVLFEAADQLDADGPFATIATTGGTNRFRAAGGHFVLLDERGAGAQPLNRCELDLLRLRTRPVRAVRSGGTTPAPDPPGDDVEQRLYTADATADGPRTGRTRSSDGRLDVALSRPAAMGGDDGPGTNPEQLFAAGFAACFHSAMRHALRPLGLRPDALQGCRVTALVHFDKGGPTTFDLAVELQAELPALDRETAQRLMELTHEVCPYSRATRGNVPVALTVVQPDGADGGDAAARRPG